MTTLDGFEFIGEPFDPRPSMREPREPAVTVTDLLRRMRAMVAAAHTSALDTQARLQRRHLSGLGA